MAANDNELAEFYELSAGTRRGHCAVGDIFKDKKLKPAELKLLEKALVANGIEHTAIQKWLKVRGIQLSDATVGAHRREQCHCFKVGAQR